MSVEPKESVSISSAYAFQRYMCYTLKYSIVNLCNEIAVSSDHLSKQFIVNLVEQMSACSLRRKWELCLIKATHERL